MLTTHYRLSHKDLTNIEGEICSLIKIKLWKYIRRNDESMIYIPAKESLPQKLPSHVCMQGF